MDTRLSLRKIFVSSMAATGLIMSVTAHGSAMNSIMSSQWALNGSKSAEVLPSDVNNCRLHMQSNSVRCKSKRIELETRDADLVYETETEISNFKGDDFSISHRRNYLVVIPTNMDDPNAKPVDIQTGWEAARHVMNCTMKGAMVSCKGTDGKDQLYSKR